MKQPGAQSTPVIDSGSYEERRRSQRVMLRVPVVLHVAGREQALRGVTLVVNNHGAMLLTPEPIPEAMQLTIENDHTRRKAAAHVVRAARTTAEGALVPVEFEEEQPGFWNVYFPPSPSPPE